MKPKPPKPPVPPPAPPAASSAPLPTFSIPAAELGDTTKSDDPDQDPDFDPTMEPSDQNATVSTGQMEAENDPVPVAEVEELLRNTRFPGEENPKIPAGKYLQIRADDDPAGGQDLRDWIQGLLSPWYQTVQRQEDKIQQLERNLQICDQTISVLQTQVQPVLGLGDHVATVTQALQHLEDKLEDLAVSRRDSNGPDRQIEIENRPAKSEKTRIRSRRQLTVEPESDSSEDWSVSESESSESERDARSRRRRSKKGSQRTPRISVRKTKGPRHEGLKTLPHTHARYKDALSYRTYRLMNTTSERDGRATGRAKDKIKRMHLTLGKHIFDGKDQILILKFLARFVREADVLRMSEAQAFIALPHFLTGFALSQFEAVRDTSVIGDIGGVNCWPEAVQYLLRSYATSSEIQKALLDLSNIRQSSGEDEKDFSNRLEAGISRAGNVHTLDEKCTMFEAGLLPETKHLVSRHRESNPQVTYLELVQFARTEGVSYRARALSRGRPGNLRRNTEGALLADVAVPSVSESDAILSQSAGPQSGQVLLGETAAFSQSLQSLPTTTYDPSTSTHSFYTAQPVPVPEQVMLASTRKWAPAANQKGAGTPHRPSDAGGVSNKPMRSTTPICFTCYAPGHYAPDCPLPLRDMAQVVRNYDSLPEEVRQAVPDVSFRRVRAQLQDNGSFEDRPSSGRRGRNRFTPKN